MGFFFVVLFSPKKSSGKIGGVVAGKKDRHLMSGPAKVTNVRFVIFKSFGFWIFITKRKNMIYCALSLCAFNVLFIFANDNGFYLCIVKFSQCPQWSPFFFIFQENTKKKKKNTVVTLFININHSRWVFDVFLLTRVFFSFVVCTDERSLSLSATMRSRISLRSDTLIKTRRFLSSLHDGDIWQKMGVTN